MKKVLLGITGCIAAYKACEILRGLQRAGVDVEVVMTESAAEFVTPTTFSALSGHPVRTCIFGDQSDAIPHIRLAQDCDLFLVAPCTGNVLAKIACGIADDLLCAVALAAHDHMAVAPAMNVHMYDSPATQENLETLKARGVAVIEPESGYLACGDVGRGRLADVDVIVQEALRLLGMGGAARGVSEAHEEPETCGKPGACGAPGASEACGAPEVCDLDGKRVLVTAGPTVEMIDPVRFVSNASTGKMGFAIAEAAARRGADVTLVAGPVHIDDPKGVDVVHVVSADEMYEACKAVFPSSDIAVFAAAVSDMKPRVCHAGKLKKGFAKEGLQNVEMVENIDILATLAASKRPSQFVVGFAAETDDVVKNATAKLASKGADLIVGNEVGEGKGFGQDFNKAWLVADGFVKDLPHMSKLQLADKILDEACANIS